MNALKISDATSGDTLALGGNVLTVTGGTVLSSSFSGNPSGGILYNGGGTYNITSTTGSLTAGGGELVLLTGPGSTLNISATISGKPVRHYDRFELASTFPSGENTTV